MESPIVSVVIPVYNQEKYVGKCIRSVLEQSFQDFEVILVNDGSTDNSLRICQKYAKKDQRVKIIDKPNEGRTQARKDGVLLAHGEYVFFIDNDDYLEKNAFSTLVQLADTYGLDLVAGNYNIVFDDWDLIKKGPRPYPISGKQMDQREMLSHFIRLQESQNWGGVLMWGTLYRRSCIMKALDNNEVYLFPPSKEMLSEDLAFNLALVKYLTSGWMTNDVIYHYRYGGGTSKYWPGFFCGGYYYDYRYELCVQNGLQQCLPDFLQDYCNSALWDSCERIYHKVDIASDVHKILLQEFDNRKIAQWARLHSTEIPDKIKENAMVQYLLSANSDILFHELDKMERFHSKHHYWKFIILKYYQKVADAVSLFITCGK